MSQIARHREVILLPFGIRSDRFAVSALFFVNGAIIGSWAAKIPVFVTRLGIDEAVMGGLIIALGVGSLLMMPVFGAATARAGSDRVVRLATILSLPALPLISLMPNIWTAGIAVFLFGGVVGGMDVAMNANAVEVEKHMRRAIMSTCHGFWSLGGLIGAGTGGALIGALGDLGHSILLTASFAALALLVLPLLAPDLPAAPDTRATRVGLPRTPLPYLIGLMALFAMIPEGSVLDWGGLYLSRELGADIAIAGWAFAGFSATMAVMRFAGDFIRHRLGAVTTLRVCTLFAMLGLAIAAMAPDVPMAVFGFAIAGIGMSNLVPILFSAAGNLPGVAPGIGLSVVTVMGYSGILLAPGLIGFVAGETGFSPIYLALASLLILVLFCAPLARGADFSSE